MTSTAVTPLELVRTGQMAQIARLPNEILIAIFKHGINELPESARSLSFQDLTSSVCKAWRGVVLGSPELWTRIFVTPSTLVGHLQVRIERSGSLELDLDICHFAPGYPDCLEIFLNAVLDLVRSHSDRLRSLTLWDVPDVVVHTIWKGFRDIHAPLLTDIAVKTKTHSSSDGRLPDLSLFPFLDGRAPKLANMEVGFPLMIRSLDVELFTLPTLMSLTLWTPECALIGYHLPPYLIEFPALCALLRTTPNLAHFALYGPVIEPDEDYPNRPPPVTLPALQTLIIHRREPGVRYHSELLSILTAPNLTHLELPWHDELRVEHPRKDRTGCLFDGEGTPRFPLVRRLYLHDSAVKWMLPTTSFIRAFPLVEDVTLGGTDVENFTAALNRSVVAKSHAAHGTLALGAWHSIHKVTLKRVHMRSWKRCVADLYLWLAARGCDWGCLTVEIESLVPPARLRAFLKCFDRLQPYARVTHHNVDA